MPGMRPLGLITLFVTAVFLGGALLAPWLHALVNWLAPHGAYFQKMAEQPFHRYVNRSILFLTLMGLWPFLNALGVRSWRDVGLVRPGGQWGRLAWGFVLGLGSLALVVAGGALGGAWMVSLDHPIQEWISRLASAALSAGVVALMEEVVFRGGIYGALRKTMSWIVAVVVSGAFFALLHFFRRPISPHEIEWSTGLVVLGKMFGGFTDWNALIPGFFNITLVGMMLAWTYQRTGNLYFSIGLHTGWVFWLKLFGFVCIPEKGYNQLFWGTQTLTDGWFGFFALLVAALVLWKWPKPDGETDSR
jgi:uncharacterized protein